MKTPKALIRGNVSRSITIRDDGRDIIWKITLFNSVVFVMRRLTDIPTLPRGSRVGKAHCIGLQDRLLPPVSSHLWG
jgi:hypothetical protein